MIKTMWLLRVVGVLQIILGIMYLFVPAFFLKTMGFNVPSTDLFYPLAMLGARFIAYGIAFIVIAKNPMKFKLWIQFMVLIQIIDLSAGIFYTYSGVVTMQISGIAMFNATWIIVLCLLWMPKSKEKRI